MVALETPEVAKGWKAKDFSLLGVDGKNYSLADVKGENGLVIMFICNHCPFVRSIIEKLVNDMKELHDKGVGVVAICANDAKEYPDDSYENMKIFAEEHNFTFPYIVDDSQEVAKEYDAVCTPDFFGFNTDLELQYRGRFDDSRMEHKEGSKRELFEAMSEIAESGEFKGEQIPSIGCSIKWKE